MSDHGKFHWNELMTRDVEGTKAFYAATVGWTFDDMPMPNGTYTIAKSGDDMAGGIFPMDEGDPKWEGVPEHWLPYLAVDDVDDCVAKAKSNGGSVMQEPFDVEGVGRIAIVRQPGGGVIGWMTPSQG